VERPAVQRLFPGNIFRESAEQWRALLRQTFKELFFNVISKVRAQCLRALRALCSEHELANIGASEKIRQ
jgi:hypothetical protein